MEPTASPSPRRLRRSSKAPLCLSAEQRARLVLLLAEGLSDSKVARRSGACRTTVDRWRMRYETGGLAALNRDEPRPGRTPTTRTEAKVREIVEATR